MKFYSLVFFLGFVLLSCQSQMGSEPRGQELDSEVTSTEREGVHVEIHSRVDTTQSDIKAIAELWTNYLNSEPDKVYDNPFWNEDEKARFPDFDLSRRLLYQFPSDQLLALYSPVILSIEREGDHFGIRTLYLAEGLEGSYRRSNPWAIQKIYAVQENGQWRLKNALPIITQNWKSRTVGKINFIHAPDHVFNEDRALKANRFCNEVTREFQFPDWEPFDFYITQSGDELGRLLGFDFFFAGYTTGIGMRENRMLLSGMGSEYYPHEFIHLVVPGIERNKLIEEGFATWKGGQGGKNFEESAEFLANELAKNDTVALVDVVDQKWGWHCAAYYTTGAVFCHSAYERGGVPLVKDLLNIPPGREELMTNLCLIFRLDSEELDGFWRSEVLRFNSK